jgi:hypothetical protein
LRCPTGSRFSICCGARNPDLRSLALVALRAFSIAAGGRLHRPIRENREASLFAMLHPARVQIKLGFAFALAILLCGCIADQKKQVAACEIDAKRTYPDKTLHGTSPSIDMANFIQACMRMAGYDFTCGPDDMSLSGSYPCYRPSSKLGRWAYETVRWLKQHGF